MKKDNDKNIKPDYTDFSYVISDPRGLILRRYGEKLRTHGYKIKILNTSDPKKSMHYNPFEYLHSDEDIIDFAETFVRATDESGHYDVPVSNNESFWISGVRTAFTAIFAYIYYEAPKREQNLLTAGEFLHAMEVREDCYDFKNAVDLMFEELGEKDPHHFAVRQYDLVKTCSDSVRRSIRSSCMGRFSLFDFGNIDDLTADDEMEFEQLGKNRTAIFVISSEFSSAYKPLLSIFYSQLFAVLARQADADKNNRYRLTVPVKIIGDRISCLNIADYDRIKDIAAVRGIFFEDHMLPEEEAKLAFGEPSQYDFDIEKYTDRNRKSRISFVVNISDDSDRENENRDRDQDKGKTECDWDDENDEDDF